MENCLVTKLAGSVDNSNLKYFDSIKIGIDATADTTNKNTIGLKFGVETKIFTENGSNSIRIINTDTWLSEITLAANSAKSIELRKDAPFTLIVPNVSNLLTFNVGDTNINSYKILYNYDINDLKYSLITSMYGLPPAWKPSCMVSAENLSTWRNIENITTIARVSGDLAALSETSYTSARLNYSYNNLIGLVTDFPVTIQEIHVLNAYKITGDLVDLVKHQRKLGRSTGSITVEASTNNPNRITFNGSVLTTSSSTLSWDSTTITWDGTTIQNSEVEP